MKRFYLSQILVLAFTSLCITVSAQFKEIDAGEKIDEKIELKINFTPGKSIVPAEKIIPFHPSSLNLEEMVTLPNAIKVTATNNEGKPIFFKGFVDEQEGKSLRDQVSIYMEYLNEYYQLNNIHTEYQFISESSDNLGMTHITIMQVLDGIEVEGGEIKLHASEDIINSANGLMLVTPELNSVAPILKVVEAEQIIIDDFVSKGIYQRLEGNARFLGTKKQMETELIIATIDDEYRLSYRVEAYANLVQRFMYYIDANSGEILKSFKNYCQFHGTLEEGKEHNHEIHKATNSTIELTIPNLPPDGPATASAQDLLNVNRNINTYESGSSFYLIDASRSMFSGSASNLPNEPVGVIWTIDAFNTNPENDDFEYDHVTSSNNSWNNKTAVSAHYNGGKAFEYFKNTHGRNSINGEGGNIISLINISDPSTGGGFDNAFWNGAAMFYGNGNTAFEPLAKALDVAGHEMSHGVVQATANLTYQGESGAMNEAFADIFGAMIDRDDWFMGEDVSKTSSFPTGRLRDMSDPHNGGNQLGDPGWQPKNVSEQYFGSQDNGGVHINSGIVNHAYYLFAETSGIGKDKAELIFYRALTEYLTKSSQFKDLRAAVEKAATDLYSDTEKNAASAAFQAVGIGGGGGTTDYETDVEMNPGEDFLLHSDVSLSNMYLRNNNLNFIANPLLDVDHISKPSITDDGNDIYFVGLNNDIYHISVIDWVDFKAGLSKVSSQGIWRNVAISKDGSKLAAISTANDNLITVLDFNTDKQKQFELYNPTFTEGISSGNVDFADAMEFDFTGEWLMYDAQSTIEGANGDIVYWDIGFINIFDNSTNTFADGDIQKLYNQLPENTSVGNPTFSKNSPYIIAFDLIENNNYSVMAANIEQNKTVQISENQGLGYPSYNNADNQLIYESPWLFGNDISLIALEDDKISPQFGSEAIIVESASRPVVFSNGKRVLANKNLKTERDFDIFPNPATELIQINIDDISEIESINIYDIKGSLISGINNFSKENRVNIHNWQSGVYSIVITDSNGQSISKQFIKK